MMRNLLPAALAAMIFLAACASSSGPERKSVAAPASQETTRGDARSRAKARTDLGFEYFAQGQLGTALQEAKNALGVDSSYPSAHNLLALVNMSLGENKAAEESFQRALQLAPKDPEISNNYGWFLCQTKREAASFEYFNVALRNPLYQTPIVALTNSAECALQLGQYPQAEAAAKRALDLSPNYARALMTMANIKYRQRQYEQARHYVGEINRVIEPTAASAWLGLRIARQMDNRDEEARYMSLLKKKFPDSTEVRLLSEGRFE